MSASGPAPGRRAASSTAGPALLPLPDRHPQLGGAVDVEPVVVGGAVSLEVAIEPESPLTGGLSAVYLDPLGRRRRGARAGRTERAEMGSVRATSIGVTSTFRQR